MILQGLDQRQESLVRAEVLDTPTPKEGASVFGFSVYEHFEKSGFSDSGLARNERELPVPFHSEFEKRVQTFERTGPSNMPARRGGRLHRLTLRFRFDRSGSASARVASHRRDETITSPRDCFNVARRPGIVSKGDPQSIDRDAQARFRDMKIRPDSVEQLVFRDQLSVAPDKTAEDVKGFWRQCNTIDAAPQQGIRVIQTKFAEGKLRVYVPHRVLCFDLIET
jgi:hypothetical protein